MSLITNRIFEENTNLQVKHPVRLLGLLDRVRLTGFSSTFSMPRPLSADEPGKGSGCFPDGGGIRCPIESRLRVLDRRFRARTTL